MELGGHFREDGYTKHGGVAVGCVDEVLEHRPRVAHRFFEGASLGGFARCRFRCWNGLLLVAADSGCARVCVFRCASGRQAQAVWLLDMLRDRRGFIVLLEARCLRHPAESNWRPLGFQHAHPQHGRRPHTADSRHRAGFEAERPLHRQGRHRLRRSRLAHLGSRGCSSAVAVGDVGRDTAHNHIHRSLRLERCVLRQTKRRAVVGGFGELHATGDGRRGAPASIDRGLGHSGHARQEEQRSDETRGGQRRA
mmetsp:Transcript_53219/g.154920  ORF Transcript_53219/g.154920 Transcript_53219/m.154920 type:complete len:252 (+) Transcript_53219:666-1421(+)